MLEVWQTFCETPHRPIFPLVEMLHSWCFIQFLFIITLGALNSMYSESKKTVGNMLMMMMTATTTTTTTTTMRKSTK